MNKESNNSMKRTSSTLSSPITEHNQKKANIDKTSKENANEAGTTTNSTSEMDINDTTTNTIVLTPNVIKDTIASILSEIQLLRELVQFDSKEPHTDYARLEETVTRKSSEMSNKLTDKTEKNAVTIASVMTENKFL